MPEYLAPGVYAEETSFRAKSIEGVSTSTTGFVGPTRRGPVNMSPELLTSFGDFQRIYGGLDALNFGTSSDGTNYLAHAVRAYFDNGGSRLYVARVVSRGATAAMATIGAMPNELGTFDARFVGDAGNGQVSVAGIVTPANKSSLGRVPLGSLLRARTTTTATTVTALPLPSTPPAMTPPAMTPPAMTPPAMTPPAMTPAASTPAPVVTTTTTTSSTATELTTKTTTTTDRFLVLTAAGWKELTSSSAAAVDVNTLTEDLAILTVLVTATDKDGVSKSHGELGLHPAHPRYIASALAVTPKRRVDALENPVSITLKDSVTADALYATLTGSGSKVFQLQGGTDSDSNTPATPGSEDYRTALELFETLEDLSIVAAPGYSSYDATTSAAVQALLITHAERRRAYRIAVLDTPPGKSVGEVRMLRSTIDSSYAALYYPWVVVANPLARPGDTNVPAEIALPPSGFVCGVYARTDIQRGVFKAPANEVVLGALRFESDINFAQQETLNPIGVNCLRSFPERGSRVWGARTASSDQEWKYVNIRRYFNYLERSIDVGTQFAVFEPNGEKLWTNVRDTIASFLENEWRLGALLGASPRQAFFVRCDRSTMSQNDLDNGRLICLVGVAAVKPAEFVIFRIGQTTADARS